MRINFAESAQIVELRLEVIGELVKNFIPENFLTAGKSRIKSNFVS